MRIHTDTLTPTDLYSAALIARADMTFTRHGSRKRDHAFDVTLRGESRRRPNTGSGGAGYLVDGFAATWDQWGVFLAVLFAADQTLTTPYYADADEFAAETGDRFGAPEDVMTDDGYVRRFESYGWPEDAHGDHTFRFEDRSHEQSCTKCSAVKRWGALRESYMSEYPLRVTAPLSRTR